MPPKPKPDNLKQKTLVGFFSQTPKKPSTTSTPAPSKTAQATPKTNTTTTTPSSTSSSGSTLGGSSQPVPKTPSSDNDVLPATKTPVGVDMTLGDDDDDDDDDSVRVAIKPSRNKRRLLIDDDSEESEPEIQSGVKTTFTEKLVGFKKAPVASRNGREAKRPRTSSPSPVNSDAYTSRSGNFSGPASTVNDESDSFIVSDDDDEAPKSRPTAKGSATTKPKPRPTQSRPSTKESSNGGTNNNFLTAAEQRTQNQKQEKKSNEECYSFLKERRDKDGNPPDSPDFDPRTLYIPSSAWKTFTPFESQFWKIKQDYYDTILFFQKGKFFELYENDAQVGHTEFDLKLTDRVKMKMVGVPEMSFDFWAAKFLAKGHKVGRVDQVETSLGAEMRVAKKGGKAEIVRRELGKVLTNGTLVDANMLVDEQAGHLISLREDPDEQNTFGICILDTSTAEFNMCTFTDDVCGTKLETVIRQLRPKEIVYTKGNLSVATTRLLKSLLSGSCIWTALRKAEGLGYDDTIGALGEIYPHVDDDDAIKEEDSRISNGIPEAIRSMITIRVAMESLGGMIWYLRTLNLDKDMLSMKNFCIYDPMRKGKGLVLDGQTLAHIEVLLNSEGTEEGSLLKLLGRCVTPFGKRLFRIWLCMPLQDVKAINERLDAVDDLMNHPTVDDTFHKLAKKLPDLERIVSRIHAGSCKPKDFLKVLSAFRVLCDGLQDLANVSESFASRSISGLLRSAPDLGPYIDNVESIFVSPEQDSADLLPEEGKDEKYDEIQGEIDALESQLEQQLKKLQKSVGSGLEFWHSNVGTKEIYLVQAPAAQKSIPKNWTKSGGTKAKTRWIVPEMAGVIRQLKEARETRNTVVKEFILRLYAAFDTDRAVWLHAVKVMAELDCLFSLAKSSSALGEPSCRPEFVENADQAFVDFKELRHPALVLQDDFIPNDVKLGGNVGRMVLLTGPNMGGKSTMMRMTAAGVIMAQLGMYVPAKSARLAPIDAILTRMGAYDNMFSNSSTFKVEMDECCKILREASPRSLVILDELGRGTSTYDGLAIAGAVLHELATHTLALSCFATHYSSLTDDYAYHPNIRNMHMNTIVNEEKRELTFTYKLTEGVAASSFGTHVANLAGVPPDVVNRAEVVSKDFANQFQTKMAKRSTASGTTTVPLVAQADFAYLIKLAMNLGREEEVRGDRGTRGGAVKQKEVLQVLRGAVTQYLQDDAVPRMT